MSDENNAGCLMAITIIGTIAVSIGSGVMAWNWIEPKSFGGPCDFPQYLINYRMINITIIFIIELPLNIIKTYLPYLFSITTMSSA